MDLAIDRLAHRRCAGAASFSGRTLQSSGSNSAAWKGLRYDEGLVRLCQVTLSKWAGRRALSKQAAASRHSLCVKAAIAEAPSEALQTFPRGGHWEVGCRAVQDRWAPALTSAPNLCNPAGPGAQIWRHLLGHSGTHPGGGAVGGRGGQWVAARGGGERHGQPPQLARQSHRPAAQHGTNPLKLNSSFKIAFLAPTGAEMLYDMHNPLPTVPSSLWYPEYTLPFGSTP